ncbi:MAG: Chemotaxis protein CheY [Bryobacteraceae bacterium]|nr:Chemotaxis protein CheY [Bryobacteraceae bacterium]
MNVMIVDDSPAMRAFIRRVLQLSSLDAAVCLEAADGEEALQLLSANWLDVVLTDIHMPRMDGEELLRRMLAHEVWKLIPVVVLSADQTRERTRRMLEMGAKGYLSKPFTPEKLQRELERSLGIHRALY